VHSLFEQVRTNDPDLNSHLREVVGGVYRRNHAALPDTVLVDGLEAAICTPLGTIADGLRLADLSPADRLAELEFDLPFGAQVVTPAEIGEVLLATLPSDDPQRAYAQQLANGRFVVGLEGFLQGSIDAVLRIPDPEAGHRFVVVDYKTNRLHERDATNPIAAYHPDLLPGHMAHSDYPLQALLYSVALHRFLSWRLGAAYQPHLHLGGIAYLFVRGMVGPNTPQHNGEVTGVFAWRPPAATVIALHRLIAGEPWR
jgi:exodeoxyribonuclease V beta subunit